VPLPVEAEAPAGSGVPEEVPSVLDDLTYAAWGGVIEQDRRPAEELRLLEFATASTDVNGNWAATFDPVPLGIGWQGTITVPGAVPTTVFTLFVNSKAIGSPQGSTPYGPITVLGGERISISGGGLAANAVYQAVLVGIMLPDQNAPSGWPMPVASGITASAPPIDVELDYQSRTDYQPVYLGTAPPGTPTSAPGWAVRMLAYDGSARLVSILNASGAWTNRTSLSYS